MRPVGMVFRPGKGLPRTSEDKPPKAVRSPHYGSFEATAQRSAQRLPTLRRGAGRPGVTRYAWPPAPLTAARPGRTVAAGGHTCMRNCRGGLCSRRMASLLGSGLTFRQCP